MLGHPRHKKMIVATSVAHSVSENVEVIDEGVAYGGWYVLVDITCKKASLVSDV